MAEELAELDTSKGSPRLTNQSPSTICKRVRVHVTRHKFCRWARDGPWAMRGWSSAQARLLDGHEQIHLHTDTNIYIWYTHMSVCIKQLLKGETNVLEDWDGCQHTRERHFALNGLGLITYQRAAFCAQAAQRGEARRDLDAFGAP